MSYGNNDDYGLCKDCFKQQQFCTCEESCSTKNLEINEECDQTFSEHNPQCQSIGEQEQQQLQQQGGLEQEQGPQEQEQVQEGQKQGSQTQEGDQTQGQLELQQQYQDQDQDQDQEGQEQTQGPQLQAQRHGDQTMENDQTISTPVDVEGVNVNVKCGDCKPTIIFPEDFIEKRKDKKDEDRGGDDMKKCHCKSKCAKDCNCCVQNMADLLRRVRNFQRTLETPADRAIDIYFTTISGQNNPNPATAQVISDVVDCSILRYRGVGQTLPVPNTAVQLCDVAGICANDTDTTPEISNVYEFLLQEANEDPEECDCKNKKKRCICPCCASGMGEELSCTATYGIQVNVLLQGQTTPIPLYVLAVKDCLAYFVNSLTNPTRICVFSLCAISRFTVGSQTIGIIEP